MKMRMLGYTDQNSPIHRLTGATKLIFFVVWSVAAMVTYDTRCLLVLFALSLVMFRLSRVKLADYSFVLMLILIFLALNHLAVFLFSPLEGVRIYGTRHDWFHIIGRYTVTYEQVFYQFNMMLKVCTVIPMALLFMLTTNPSEFAASLNRIGVSYRIAYAVAIALRYIPDVQRDYREIAWAAQARGIDLSRKERLGKRMKNMLGILMPLIFTSLERIETVSAAMELRGFGRGKKRTWYSARPFAPADAAAIALVILLAAATMIITFHDGTRFYSPWQ
jgi:energy-coupling factor transport system permease protein